MSRYRVEWQLGGEITIDTGDTDWTPGEVEMQLGQELLRMEDEVVDAVATEFDDCDVRGDGASQFKLERLR